MDGAIMRVAIPLIATAALLAGCVVSNPPQQVSSTPPQQVSATISYRVNDANHAQADAQAAAYCRQYGQASILQTVQQDSAGRVATYTCSNSVATVQPGYVGSSTPPAVVQCADAFHQDRPGGSDYHGPYVAACPRAY
jgi:outer membrane murein-binding lipoprotein Lpp